MQWPRHHQLTIVATGIYPQGLLYKGLCRSYIKLYCMLVSKACPVLTIFFTCPINSCIFWLSALYFLYFFIFEEAVLLLRYCCRISWWPRPPSFVSTVQLFGRFNGSTACLRRLHCQTWSRAMYSYSECTARTHGTWPRINSEHYPGLLLFNNWYWTAGVSDSATRDYWWWWWAWSSTK